MMKLSLLLLLCLLFACGGSSTALQKTKEARDCSLPNDLLIRWGVWNDSTGVLKGYELDANARLWRYTTSTKRSTYDRDSIGTIEKPQLCYFVDTVKKTFLAVQTLYAPGQISRYIEYQHPTANVNLRAVWNAKFQTHGSKEFRAIFDSLSTIAPVQNP